MGRIIRDFFFIFVVQAIMCFGFQIHYGEGRFLILIPYFFVMLFLFSYAGKRIDYSNEFSHVRIVLRSMALQLLMLTFISEIVIFMVLNKGL